MLHRSLSALFLSLSFSLWLGACNSTELAESWIDPSVKTLHGYTKVFVAYVGADASVQRVAEDALASHLHAPAVVPCYTLFPDARGLDASVVKARLREQGFDAAVVMRVAGVEQEVSFTPNGYPASYRSFGGYWGWAHDPGTLRTDEIVHVETNLYSLADDKLLYAARSETFNPSSTETLVGEIAERIADDLEEKGVLRPAPAKPY